MITNDPKAQGANIAALKTMPIGSGATGALLSSSARVVESKCVWKVARNGEYNLYE